MRGQAERGGGGDLKPLKEEAEPSALICRNPLLTLWTASATAWEELNLQLISAKCQQETDLVPDVEMRWIRTLQLSRAPDPKTRIRLTTQSAEDKADFWTQSAEVKVKVKVK